MAKTRTKVARKRQTLSGARKRVLVVLFVPSVERDGATSINQQYWVDAALEMFGRVFGGATAYPKAKGVWRDDERGGALVRDEPVVVHCYTTPVDIEDFHKPPRTRGFLPEDGTRSSPGRDRLGGRR